MQLLDMFAPRFGLYCRWLARVNVGLIMHGEIEH